MLIAILIIIICLGYLLIWGLAHAASKRREAWERANKQMWEIYDRQKQWDRLNAICKQKPTYNYSTKIVIPADMVETIDDIERLR